MFNWNNDNGGSTPLFNNSFNRKTDYVHKAKTLYQKVHQANKNILDDVYATKIEVTDPETGNVSLESKVFPEMTKLFKIDSLFPKTRYLCSVPVSCLKTIGNNTTADITKSGIVDVLNGEAVTDKEYYEDRYVERYVALIEIVNLYRFNVNVIVKKAEDIRTMCYELRHIVWMTNHKESMNFKLSSDTKEILASIEELIKSLEDNYPNIIEPDNFHGHTIPRDLKQNTIYSLHFKQEYEKQILEENNVVVDDVYVPDRSYVDFRNKDIKYVNGEIVNTADLHDNRYGVSEADAIPNLFKKK